MKQKSFVVFGIFFGIVLTFAVLIISLSNVLTSESFYLKQEDRYSLTEAMGLENFDDFYKIEQQVRAGFSGRNVDGAEERVLADNDSGVIIKAGKITVALRIAAIIAVIAFAAAVVPQVKKHTRQCMRPIGIAACVSALAACAVINVVLLNAPAASAWHLILPGTENLSATLTTLFSESFAHDFIFGTVKFFDFLMIIPMGVSYLLVHFSKQAKADTNEDYMYQ